MRHTEVSLHEKNRHGKRVKWMDSGICGEQKKDKWGVKEDGWRNHFGDRTISYTGWFFFALDGMFLFCS